MIFREIYKVNSHSCDFNQAVSPSALMTYLQECANLQLETYGPKDADMRADGHCFILSRMGMAVYSPLRAYETITAETWAAPSRGFSFLRCHRLLRGQDVICEATSVWALLGIADRRPQKVETLPLHFDTEPLSDFGLPKRVRPDTELLQKVGEHTVRYRDVDLNMHMNNTVYADILCAHLPMQNQYVSSLSISYFQEAKLNENLSIFHHEAPQNTHIFRTVRADGEINIEASLTLSPL